MATDGLIALASSMAVMQDRIDKLEAALREIRDAKHTSHLWLIVLIKQIAAAALEEGKA